MTDDREEELRRLDSDELKRHAAALGRLEKSKPVRNAKVVTLRGDQTGNIAPDADDQWRSHLIYNEAGLIKPRLMANFSVMIRLQMPSVFAWNELARSVFVVAPPPWAHMNGSWITRPLQDNDLTQCVEWLERRGLTPRTAEAGQSIVSVAQENGFHPIRDYLTGLKWDGKSRIAHLAHDYIGAPDVKIYTVFVARWVLSAVARAFAPGCKADCILILEGEQGTLKSTFLKTLASEEYFTDAIMDIESKDAALQMQGIWIGELPELNAFQRKEADSIKSWLSRSTDKFRPPFGRLVVDYPRHCVIAGTMNPLGYGYLRDPSGARRFWPVPVLRKIDIARVAEDRDQIWAEAVALYRKKKNWHLTPDEEEMASGLMDERQEEEPWAYAIDRVMYRSSRFTTHDCVAELGIPASQQSQATSRRIGAYLRRRGYEKLRGRDGSGNLDYVWSKSGG